MQDTIPPVAANSETSNVCGAHWCLTTGLKTYTTAYDLSTMQMFAGVLYLSMVSWSYLPRLHVAHD